MTRMLFAVIFAGVLKIASAQSGILLNTSFNSVVATEAQSLAAKSPIQARHYRVVEMSLPALYNQLQSATITKAFKAHSPVIFHLPLPDGSERAFRIVENTTLAPELAKKFPQIKTYNGYSTDNTHELAKLDITPQGFHAMILTSGKSPVFIDPMDSSDPRYYLVYHKKELINPKPVRCGVTGNLVKSKPAVSKPFKHLINYNSCELKTYRLAMAATAEYTQFHGGTVADALSAEATTMNRVNGIYETDMAITMQIIANNDAIIYTDPNNEPYTSGVPNLLIAENQVNVDAVIGSDFYDIGHVVDAAGSGLASIASVCNVSRKAQGVTGTDSPVGDPFDVDFVAHEMGHQFGANHTQNNDCNRNDDTAVEPGSGSTIMGYAGICPPNVQRNSDGYFNGISLSEMGDFVSSAEHTCPVRTPIASAPVVNTPANLLVIPASTPFFLTTQAINQANGVLSFAWEQIDPEISQQPPASDALGGPNFRSLPPVLSPTRYFPSLNTLANNGPYTWEVLPDVARNMNFRVSVRNNTLGGSCNAYGDAALTVDANAGPFVITYPAAAPVVWLAGSKQQINWSVANTASPPISALTVDVLLSTDGGQTYNQVLAQALENSGTAVINIPDISTDNARIMVKATTGYFFNISSPVTISAASTGFQLTKAVRNPLRKSTVFVYFNGLVNPALYSYSLGGTEGGSVRLDSKNSRFIIDNVTSPRAGELYIVAAKPGENQVSNLILIPGIL